MEKFKMSLQTARVGFISVPHDLVERLAVYLDSLGTKDEDALWLMVDLAHTLICRPQNQKVEEYRLKGEQIYERALSKMSDKQRVEVKLQRERRWSIKETHNA